MPRKIAAPTFSFRPGCRVAGVSAEVAGQELGRIREAHGTLTPELTVEESRPEGAPLHPVFEWDDAKAASEHRLGQARSLIRAVYIRRGEADAPQPVWVHVVTEEGRCYEPAEVVVQSPALLESALSELRANLHAAQRSVSELLELAREGGAAEVASRAADAARNINLAAEAVA